MNLNEEVKSGFLVTSFRKKIWQKELEMVKIFIGICQKHNLKYFASGGTLLGAIRHNGFIPWDDDIDLMMPRRDYEKFLEVARAELDSNYFLQCYKTEKLYPNGHAQIRNNSTTCLMSTSYTDLKLDKNCGIFIDIFPFDDILDDYKLRVKYTKKIGFLKKLCENYIYKNKNVVKRFIVRSYFWFHSINKTIKKIDLLSKKYENQTNTVALTSFVPGYEKNVWQKDWFDGTLLHPFEDIMISIPKKFDEVLRTEYGEYMKIPENKDGTIHGKCFFDCDNSFERYKDLSKDEFDNLLKNSII